MKKISFKILLCFISSFGFAQVTTYFSPDVALYNSRISDIPPLKISGFILGEKKDTFLKKLKSLYEAGKIEKIIIKKRSPERTVYKVNTGSTENLALYLIDNVLFKITIINIRPFENHRTIVRRFVYRYGRAKYVSLPLPSYMAEGGDYWYKYVWDFNYIYTPVFIGRRESVPLRLELDFSMRDNFTKRILYSYMIEERRVLFFLGYPLNG